MLPNGLPFSGSLQSASDVQWLTDITYIDSSDNRRVKQDIFDEMMAIIASARHFILLDMFLYNPFQGHSTEVNRRLSSELTHALLAARNNHPNIVIIVMTDPINTLYGGLPSEQFTQLQAAGISVVETCLEALPDSNRIYSSFWRLFRSFLSPNAPDRLTNPFGEGKVPIYSYLTLLNFKANHRKTLVADNGSGWQGLVTSANPHDASSAHHNVAVRFDGPAVLDLLESERAVLDISTHNSQLLNHVDQWLATRLPNAHGQAIAETLDTTLQIITERCIKQAVLNVIDGCAENDELWMVMFYLSDREIILALKRAHLRNVLINVLLDPNKDAFGRAKKGIPNRPVASELNRYGIAVRWCDTHGEQCHSKLVYSHSKKTQKATLIAGSANLTRRNLDNFNLETDVVVSGGQKSPFFQDVEGYVDTLWNNQDGMAISVPYDHYAECSRMKWLLYRLMEKTGLCTF